MAKNKSKKWSNPTISFFPECLDELQQWTKQDRKTAIRIYQLIDAVVRSPFDGIGKPEPLKHLGNNIWSRRITEEHRLVYKVSDNTVTFIQCRYHY